MLLLAACPGPPTGSISHRPNNVYDESFLQGGPSAAARLAQESLEKSYPIASDRTSLVNYLEGIGSSCISDGGTRTACEMKSYFEMKYAYWFINAVVATGDTLERVEYTFTTTVESSRGKVKSINVTKVENRLE